METLTVGDITFVADGSGFSVRFDEVTGGRTALSNRDAARLQEFLRRHIPRERRIGFRVRIPPLSDRIRTSFQVRLTIGTRVVEVRPVDFSLTGILVETDAVALRHDAEVDVHLSLDQRECRLMGTVVRLERDLLALHFTDSLKNGELSPPEPLLGIYRALETEWLRHRRG